MNIKKCIALSFLMIGCQSLTSDKNTSAFDQIVSSQKRKVAQEDWKAASAANMQAAVCRRKEPSSRAELLAYFNSLPKMQGDEPGAVYTVYGFDVENERSDLISSFASLLKSREKSSKTVPSNLKTAFKVPNSCKKIVCLAEAVFGPTVGLQMLYLKHRHDINTSPYSWQSADLFTENELRYLIRGLELIPLEGWPLAPNQKMIRFLRGMTRAIYKDDNVLANAVIEIFDGYESADAFEQQYVVLHELGHRYAETVFGNLSKVQAWVELGGWKRVDESTFIKMRNASSLGHTFVSGYAEAEPWEDFAESLVSYRLSPQRLKNKSPKKYEFMKTLVFDGLEFTSEQSCKRPLASKEMIENVSKNPPPFSDSEIKEIGKNCYGEMMSRVFAFWPTSYYTSCVNFEATRIWAHKQPKIFKDLVSRGYYNNAKKESRLHFQEVQERAKNASFEILVEKVLSRMKGSSALEYWRTFNDKSCEEWAQSSARGLQPDADSEASRWTRTSEFDFRKPNQFALESFCKDVATRAQKSAVHSDDIREILFKRF